MIVTMMTEGNSKSVKLLWKEVRIEYAWSNCTYIKYETLQIATAWTNFDPHLYIAVGHNQPTLLLWKVITALNRDTVADPQTQDGAPVAMGTKTLQLPFSTKVEPTGFNPRYLDDGQNPYSVSVRREWSSSLSFCEVILRTHSVIIAPLTGHALFS